MEDTLSGAIRQSYNEPEKYQGCKYCNSNHPDHEEIYTINTKLNGTHFITIWNTFNHETGEYQTEDIELDTCPMCGRKL